MPKAPVILGQAKSRQRQREAALRRQRARPLPTNSTAWRQIREQHLNRQPLCVECLAEDYLNDKELEVDHIDGNPANNSPENLQTLCKGHHSAKTHRETR